MQEKFDPTEKIRFIHGLMKKEVDELIKFLNSSKVNVAETQWPPMDVFVSAEEIRLFVELPGMSTSDFTVYQYEDLIVVEGRRPKSEFSAVQFVRVEREGKSFKRVLRLPFCIEEGETVAKLKEGVLEIRIARCACENTIDVDTTQED
jgi:HSP20 family protein